MRDLQELKFTHLVEEDYPAPPPLGGVAAFERAFGTKLPPDYLAFLTFSNGGSVERGCFGGYAGTPFSEVSVFFHLTDDPEDDYGVWQNTKRVRDALAAESEFLVEGDDNAVYVPPLAPSSPARESLRVAEDFAMEPVAFGETGSGNLLIFDQARGGRVYYVARAQGKLMRLADDFAAFIDGLYDDYEL